MSLCHAVVFVKLGLLPVHSQHEPANSCSETAFIGVESILLATIAKLFRVYHSASVEALLVVQNVVTLAM